MMQLDGVTQVLGSLLPSIKRNSSRHVCSTPLYCNHTTLASLQKYGYNIPANMYAAGALRRLLMLNQAVWGSEEVTDRVLQLLKDIHEGLEKWGMTKAPDGSTVYAYEVGLIPGMASLLDLVALAVAVCTCAWESGA
jgi:hypothetical protein